MMRAKELIFNCGSWRVLAVVAAVAGVGCGKDEAPEVEKPRLVITVEVPAIEGTVERIFSGLATSASGGGISFEVGGRVTSVSAKTGQTYQEGDELAKLDPTDYLNQLANAKAQLTEAEQSLLQTEELFAIQNATKAQFDAAAARRDALAAQFASAQKKVDDCILRMPYAGVMGDVDLDEQTVVAAGKVVMTIQKSGGVEFEAGLPAGIVGEVSVGMAGVVTLGAIGGGTSWDAEVITVSRQAGGNTTYPVNLAIKGDTSEIRDGMDGEVALTLKNADGAALFLPAECVFGRAEGEQYVWVIAGAEGESGVGVAERRKVEMTGRVGVGGTVGIKAGGGATPGERIVSRGVGVLKNGQEVRWTSE